MSNLRDVNDDKKYYRNRFCDGVQLIMGYCNTNVSFKSANFALLSIRKARLMK